MEITQYIQSITVFLSWYVSGMLIYYVIIGLIQGVKEGDINIVYKEMLLWPVYASLRVGYTLGYLVVNLLAHFLS